MNRLPRSTADRFAPYLVVYGVWVLGCVLYLLAMTAEDVFPPCSGVDPDCTAISRFTLGVALVAYGPPLTIIWWITGAVAVTLLNLLPRMGWWLRAILALVVCVLMSVAVCVAVPPLFNAWFPA